MSDEHVHPWDRPGPTGHFDVPVVRTTLPQVLTGLPVELPERGRRGRPDRSERCKPPFRLPIIFSSFNTFIPNVYNATCSISDH
jgi:hypothetical protein